MNIQSTARPVVILDVLGTLVDQRGSLRRQASTVTGWDDAAHRLEPWPDTVEALTRLATDVTVMGLSNASRRVLTGLSSSSGMRWHQVLSAEDTQSYKPDLAIYQAAVSAAPVNYEPPYMVAAHAWDLRAASEAGLRTAYVPRPNGDPPTERDTFDLRYSADANDAFPAGPRYRDAFQPSDAFERHNLWSLVPASTADAQPRGFTVELLSNATASQGVRTSGAEPQLSALISALSTAYAEQSGQCVMKSWRHSRT